MGLLQPLFKAYNLVKREFVYPSQVDYQSKYIPWSSDESTDSFPQELAKAIENSPTATSCISTYTDFITGEGFNNPELEKKIINEQGETFYWFHHTISASLSHFDGFACLIKYNAFGDPISYSNLPFESIRLVKPDSNGVVSRVLYNPYFGTSLYNPKDSKVYDLYNPKGVIEQMITQKKDFKGQIYWFGIRKPLHPHYPRPDYYSAHRWMSVENQSAVYFDKNLSDGFLQPAMLRMIGDPNAPAYPDADDERDKSITKGQALDEMLTSSFSGAQNSAKLWSLWGNTKEEWPDIISFPTNNNGDTYRVQDEHATKKITVATKVPGILANVNEGVGLGGDGNTIRASVKLMQQRVKRIQSILIDFYQEMFKNLPEPYLEPIRITPYNPFPELQNIDPAVWQELTKEERRLWIKNNTEIELIDINDPILTQPNPPLAKAKNIWFSSYPDKVRDNIKTALKWQEQTQNKCIKPVGIKIAERITSGGALTGSEIRRIANFLSKNVIHKDKPFNESCEAVQFAAWGGSEMMMWCNEKVKELKE